MKKKTFGVIVAVFVSGLFLISLMADLRNIRRKQENASLPESVDSNQGIGKPIDPESGLVIGPGFNLVKTNCLGCHSGKLIIQNRASRATWKETIVWMQETQNLWDLGENEAKILDYLAEHYAPGESGRRLPLVEVEWYDLEQ